MASKSKDIDVLPPDFQDEIVRMGATAETMDPAEISRAIVENIGRATSVEELLKQVATLGAGDIVGIPIKIQGQRWNKSAFDEGMGVFAVIDAVRVDSGELITFTCGAANVMAKVFKAHQEGWELPPVEIYKAEHATANGYYPLDLIAAR